jgi:hypothetical protein
MPIELVGKSLRAVQADMTCMSNLQPTTRFERLAPATLLAALALGSMTLTGCQVDVGGQTLPSPYYLQDDIQYFPSGPEFKLSKEAAALKAYKDEMQGDAPCNNCGHCDSCR